jgi:hypothetical protein
MSHCASYKILELVSERRMPTLAIHAPSSKPVNQGFRSFAVTVRLRRGHAYAISQSEYTQIMPGCDVIVLDKDAAIPLRAEGKLRRLKRNGTTLNHIPRYDVLMTKLRTVPYQPLPLMPGGRMFNRRGVRIL